MILGLLLIWSFTDRLALPAPDPDGPVPLDALAFDGSILLKSKTTVFHYSSQGRLIRTIGKQGNGPGEFVYIESTVWDGRNYIVRDRFRNDSSFFHRDGLFLARRFFHSRYLAYVDGRYISIDYGPTYKNDPSLPALYHVTFDEHCILKFHTSFHHYLPVFFTYARDFRMHYFVVLDNELYVINQASPMIFVYDKSFKLKRKFKAGLGGYMEPLPEKQPFNGFKYFEKIKTISIIYKMFKINDLLAVCYLGPVQGDNSFGVRTKPQSRRAYLQLIDRAGAPVAPVTITNGPCLGIYRDKLLFADNFMGKEFLFRWEPAAPFGPPVKGRVSLEKP
jgi:hypothetical protein